MSSIGRVVVTGWGWVSSLGLEDEDVWGRLEAGRTGIRTLPEFADLSLSCQVGARVDPQELNPALEGLGRRPSDSALDMVRYAAHRALSGSGWLDETPERRALDVLIGTGMGPAETFYGAFQGFSDKGVRGLRPTTVPRAMYNVFPSQVSIEFGLTGAHYTLVSACASSTNAIGEALRRIRHGYTEAVLCGGVDSFFNPLFFGVWNRLGVLSKNPDPVDACRPFDTDRDGCVLGEGAGLLVLESEESARSRGVRVRGEILGYGESSDATHLTRPSAEGQATAIQRALADAGRTPEQLGLINTHGTATRSNDPAETKSLGMALGDRVREIPATALKSYFGHTLGASGVLETIATLLMLERGLAAPNLNLESPDPECSLRFVGAHAESISVDTALKNSFGFGGGNAVLVLGRS